MQVDYHICGTHTYDLVGSSIQLINIATKATICASLKFEINEERLFRIWECGEYTVYWCAHMTFLYSMFAFTVATSQSVWIDCKQNYTNALASTPTFIIQLDAVLLVSTDVFFFRTTCSTNIINTHWFDYGYGTYYIVYSAHTNDWTWENRLKIITIYICKWSFIHWWLIWYWNGNDLFSRRMLAVQMRTCLNCNDSENILLNDLFRFVKINYLLF